MIINRKTRLQLIVHRLLFVALFLGILGMLAWLGQHYQQQFDLTANKRHSISQQSVELLENMPGEIKIHAYTRDDITGKAIAEIISRYQRHKQDVLLRVLNPDIDILDVQSDGVVMNRGIAFVIHYGGRSEHINSLSEQAISNALLRLLRSRDQQLVFIHGHGEFSADNDATRSYSLLAKQLADMGFSLQSVNLLKNRVPDNTRLLVIAAPQSDYMDGELAMIRQYLQQGGNLLWLAEPGDDHGLKPLATGLGIQLHEGVVIDNNEELRRSLNIRHPSMIPVTEYFDHPVTETLRYNTLFPTARGLSPLAKDVIVENWQPLALFNSQQQSWSERDGLTQSEAVFSLADGDIAGPITLAVALQRPRQTASQSASQAANHADTQVDTKASSQAGRQRVIIIGDGDFLSDQFVGIGANLNLGLNIVNWLTGDDDLIAIDSPGSPDLKLVLDESTLLVIALGFFLLIPLGLLASGFIIWHRRNRY